MAAAVIPSAKAIYLCDFHVGYSNGKIDLYCLFNSIRPTAYPYRKESFVYFARLLGGLGDVSFHIDTRRAADQQLIHWDGHPDSSLPGPRDSTPRRGGHTGVRIRPALYLSGRVVLR